MNCTKRARSQNLLLAVIAVAISLLFTSFLITVFGKFCIFLMVTLKSLQRTTALHPKAHVQLPVHRSLYILNVVVSEIAQSLQTQAGVTLARDHVHLHSRGRSAYCCRYMQ
jgi:hypothetical protein